LAKCQAGMIPQGRNDMDFCLPPFLEVIYFPAILNKSGRPDFRGHLPS
jgi:hypothetical protein